MKTINKTEAEGLLQRAVARRGARTVINKCIYTTGTNKARCIIGEVFTELTDIPLSKIFTTDKTDYAFVGLTSAYPTSKVLILNESCFDLIGPVVAKRAGVTFTREAIELLNSAQGYQDGNMAWGRVLDTLGIA